MDTLLLLIITAPAIAPIILLVVIAQILKGRIHFLNEFFSEEAKLERSKLRKTHRIKEQERAKKRAIIEHERLLHEQEKAKERRIAEREKVKKNLAEKEKNEKEKVELFLRTYPLFTKFVKSYCSFITLIIPFIRYFLIIYGTFFFGLMLMLMIDEIFFSGNYKDMIIMPLVLIQKNNLYIYAERLGNDNAGIIMILIISSISLFIYGKLKVKKWEKI